MQLELNEPDQSSNEPNVKKTIVIIPPDPHSLRRAAIDPRWKSSSTFYFRISPVFSTGTSIFFSLPQITKLSTNSAQNRFLRAHGPWRGDKLAADVEPGAKFGRTNKTKYRK